MRRVSPATVMSALALFFSLGGVGLAASGYRITSIWQIKPSVRHALRGERGPRGFAGPRGATGTQSPAAATPPLSDTYTVVSFTAQLSSDAATAGETAACDPSDNLVSGGFQNSSGVTITSSAPWPSRIPLGTLGHNAWVVQATLASGSTSGTFQAWALCAR